jgi:hypothetical protein
MLRAEQHVQVRVQAVQMLCGIKKGSRQHTSAYVSIRQHTSAYVNIRQHTPAYVRIRPHTSAYARTHLAHTCGIKEGKRLGAVDCFSYQLHVKIYLSTACSGVPFAIKVALITCKPAFYGAIKALLRRY